ncbi:MAG: DUF2948 family protein [Acidobacteria bacterium]|nr:DUF2948 family protein [Acidobacteriota bacterium]
MDGVSITDRVGLSVAAAYLHDAVFEREDIRYDQQERTLTISLWREVREEMTSKRIFLVLYRWSCPHRRCELVFQDVDACRVDVKADLERYVLTNLSLVNGGDLKLEADCLDLVAETSHLNGSFRDHEELVHTNYTKTTIALFPFRRK